MKRSLPLVAIFTLFSAAAFGVDRPTAQKSAREILRADGFWDIAATTGFFDHHGPPRQLPFDALQQGRVRGAMLGIGTLTEVIIAGSLTEYNREVPAETRPLPAERLPYRAERPNSVRTLLAPAAQPWVSQLFFSTVHRRFLLFSSRDLLPTLLQASEPPESGGET